MLQENRPSVTPERIDSMPRGARMKSNNGVYHVMFRGANRQEIFHDDEDNNQFLDTIQKYKKSAEMKLYAWCLMNNHAHLLLREGNEAFSKTMKRIGVSFAYYYNRKYKTTGHLFQDRFKSENVETKRYFLTCIRYIHQNPVKAGIVTSCDGWKWSSCSDYYGKKSDYKALLDEELLLSLFSSDLQAARKEFKEFNGKVTEDEHLDIRPRHKRLTDEEAREEIKHVIAPYEIAQVKSLPKRERDQLLRTVKKIKHVSQRQAARILGVSPMLINRA